jgi:hypothetical protein
VLQDFGHDLALRRRVLLAHRAIHKFQHVLHKKKVSRFKIIEKNLDCL